MHDPFSMRYVVPSFRRARLAFECDGESILIRPFREECADNQRWSLAVFPSPSNLALLYITCQESQNQVEQHVSSHTDRTNGAVPWVNCWPKLRYTGNEAGSRTEPQSNISQAVIHAKTGFFESLLRGNCMGECKSVIGRARRPRFPRPVCTAHQPE